MGLRAGVSSAPHSLFISAGVAASAVFVADWPGGGQTQTPGRFRYPGTVYPALRRRKPAVVALAKRVGPNAGQVAGRGGLRGGPRGFPIQEQAGQPGGEHPSSVLFAYQSGTVPTDQRRRQASPASGP